MIPDPFYSTLGDAEKALDAFLRIEDRAGCGEWYLALLSSKNNSRK